MNPCPVLIGRRQELATLRSLLETGGGFALVSGEAGIGKSRLVREFALEAEKHGRTVVWGRPEQVEQPGPFALIVDLLEGLAERSSSQLARDARELAGELLRPASDGQRATPTARQTAAELRGLLSQLEAPPMVVLEDLHAADEASHAVVLHLARSGGDDGHVIIGTLRPEAAAASPSLSRLLDELKRERIGSDIKLSALGHEETAAMLEAMWGRAATSEELSALERLGEGVPFFIEELAASAEESALRVPKSLEQSIVTRMRGLGSQAGLVLTTASLMVGALDPAVLAQACDKSVVEVTRYLAEAAKAGLVADDEGKLLFRHALVRDSIAASLVFVEAERLHGRLARAIETVYSDSLDVHSTALAMHYRDANDHERALAFFLTAGRRSLAVAASDDARAAFRQANEMMGGDSPEAMYWLAEVGLRDGQEAQAAELYRAAAKGWLKAGARTEAARALGRLAWVLVRLVRSSEVGPVLDEAMTLMADNIETFDYARLLVQKGVMNAFLLGLRDEAEPILERAAEICRYLGDQALLAQALDGLAHVADSRGSLRKAVELGAQAIDIASRSDDAEAIGRTHNNHALILASHGDPEEALAVLAEGRERWQRTYGRAAAGALDVSHGWIARLMGRPHDVAALTARGQVAWQQERGYLWVLEVWSALEVGNHARARSTIAAAWDELGGRAHRDASLAEPQGLNQNASQALQAEALLRLAEGDGEASWTLANVIVTRDRGQGSEPFDLGQSLVILVYSGLLSNHIEQAEEELEALASIATDYEYPFLEACSHELRALISRSRGELNRSKTELEAAVSFFERCRNLSDRARCSRLLADVLLLLNGDSKPAALEHLRLSRELAFQAGAVRELNAAEGGLRALGVRPRSGRPRGRASEKGLSPREAEVSVLVAAGSSNADIAARLFLSERTVQDHISSSLRKLGLSGRASLASWAAKQGMV